MSRIFNPGNITDKVDFGTGHNLLSTLNEFSIALWMLPQMNNTFNLIAVRELKQNNTGFEIQLASRQFKVQVTFVNANLQRNSVTNTYFYNIWKPLVVTYDGGSPTSSLQTAIHIYYNLKEVAYATGQNGTQGVKSNLGNPYRLGNSTDATGNDAYNGGIAFVQVFNTVLSFNEAVQCSLFPGSVLDGLVGFWPLWGDSAIEYDLSGFGHNGIVTGTTKGSTDPPICGMFNPSRRLRYPSYVVPAPPPPPAPPVIKSLQQIVRTKIGVGL